MIKRYNAYFGSNVSIDNIAKECDDGRWVKFNDIKEMLGLFSEEDVQEQIKDLLSENASLNDELREASKQCR